MAKLIVTVRGRKYWKSASEVERDGVYLRGGPKGDFPCEDPGMLECALYACQKNRKCKLAKQPTT